MEFSRHFARVVVGVAAMGLVAGCSSSSGKVTTAAHTTPTTARRGSFTDSGTSTEWNVYGHDLSNSRTNVRESHVDVATVARLRPVWSMDGLVGVTGTPAVVGGVAYFADWKGAVHAVVAATGKPVWTVQLGGSFVAAPLVAGEAVFVAQGSMLYRLDRSTGATRWKVQTDTNAYAQISASPVLVDGMILQGTASFENIANKKTYSFRGSIAAYNAATGALRWKFYTTPNNAKSGAGVGVWSTPAVDKQRHMLFVGTGQNVSPPTGPLADSIIALDYRTGRLVWSRQFTYPDVFSGGYPNGKDADVGASPNLWTSNGRDLVGAGDKGGTFHALDRSTGQVVWNRRLTPGSFFGGQIGSSAFVDGKLIATSNVGGAPTEMTKVFALDPATGSIVWTAEPFPGKVFAPVSAVPGVAFVATDKGTMAALDTRTGRRLWSHTAPGPVSCGPSIVDGRVLWGYGFTLFAGAGPGGIISFTVAS